jgi:hypothetical protein
MLKTPPVDLEIKRLVANSPLSLSEIALKAGVPYKPLWRFISGASSSLNAVSAELVYYFFCGRSFSEPGKPIRRAPFTTRRGEERAA